MRPEKEMQLLLPLLSFCVFPVPSQIQRKKNDIHHDADKYKTTKGLKIPDIVFSNRCSRPWTCMIKFLHNNSTFDIVSCLGRSKGLGLIIPGPIVV
jgi:hypothetical protein